MATTSKGKVFMLWTIFVILLILWLLGFVGFHVLGAYIHLMLLIALVVLIIQLISGLRPLYHPHCETSWNFLHYSHRRWHYRLRLKWIRFEIGNNRRRTSTH